MNQAIRIVPPPKIGDHEYDALDYSWLDQRRERKAKR